MLVYFCYPCKLCYLLTLQYTNILHRESLESQTFLIEMLKLTYFTNLISLLDNYSHEVCNVHVNNWHLHIQPANINVIKVRHQALVQQHSLVNLLNSGLHKVQGQTVSAYFIPIYRAIRQLSAVFFTNTNKQREI